MNIKRFFLVLVGVLALHGCAWLNLAPPIGEEAGESQGVIGSRNAGAGESEEVLALLAYHQRWSLASAEDQRKEFAAVSQAYNRDKTELGRLRLGMLLIIPNAPFRDDARLAALLDAAASRNAPPDSPRRQLLTVLYRIAFERQRQQGQPKDEHRKLEAQLRDEQRRADEAQRRAEEAQKRSDEFQRRGDELQKRADEVQAKLDKLLAIERELRSRAPRRPSR